MTDDEIRQEVRQLSEQVFQLQNESEALKRIPDAVARLQGTVEVLQDIVLQGFDTSRKKIEVTDENGQATEIRKENSVKNAIQVVAIILVPILVALIGLYAATHGGGSVGK